MDGSSSSIVIQISQAIVKNGTTEGRLRSGFKPILNGAPVLRGSKISSNSVCFAHPDIGEAHADIPSGATEAK